MQIYIDISTYYCLWTFIEKANRISYLRNHDPVDFGGKSNPSSGGTPESNFPTSSLHILIDMSI